MKPLMAEKQSFWGELRIKNQTSDVTNGAVRGHCETEFCLGEENRKVDVMDRFTSMEKSISRYRKERKIKKQEYLNSKYEMLSSSLMDILNGLAQEIDEQRIVKYITFQRLLSCERTGSYEIDVGMSAAMLYLDEEMEHAFWKPELLHEDMDKAMQDIEKILGKEYVQVEEYELLYLKQKLLLDDWKLLVETLKKMAGDIAENIMRSSLKLEDEIEILCGNYMDRMNIIYKVKIN